MNKNQIIEAAYKLIIEEKDRAVYDSERLGVYVTGLTDLAAELIEDLEEEPEEETIFTIGGEPVLAEARPLAEPQPEHKKRGGSKPLQLDMGKIGALSRAGWSVEKIAEEMGVSGQTIRNRLNDMKKKGDENDQGPDRTE